MKFFSRRKMRSIHLGFKEREARRQRMHVPEEGTPTRRPVIQVLCGQIDRLIVVASLHNPEFKPGLVDRLLVLAELERIPAVVVLTKADLAQCEDWQAWVDLYRGLGYPCHAVSSHTGQGLEQLADFFGQGRSALCGHSGVGKSSLLSCFCPEGELAVGEVSQATGKGQHTTTRVRLIRGQNGAEWFDLPGLKLAPLECSPLEVARCFPDFQPYRGGCRFRDCLHQDEPGCGVKAACQSGEISPHRYASYLRILESL